MFIKITTKQKKTPIPKPGKVQHNPNFHTNQCMNEKTSSNMTNRFLPPANGFEDFGSQKQCSLLFLPFNANLFKTAKKVHSNRL